MWLDVNAQTEGLDVHAQKLVLVMMLRQINENDSMHLAINKTWSC